MFKHQGETNSGFKSKDDFYCAGAGEMQIFEGKEHHLHAHFSPIFDCSLFGEFLQSFYSNLYETLILIKEKPNPKITHLTSSGSNFLPRAQILFVCVETTFMCRHMHWRRSFPKAWNAVP